MSFAIVTLIKLMSPVAVHLTEEAWHELGGEGSVHEQEWPTWDENLAKASSITLVVQINGKVRAKLSVGANMTKEEMEKVALENDKVQASIGDKTVVKVIAIP